MSKTEDSVCGGTSSFCPSVAICFADSLFLCVPVLSHPRMLVRPKDTLLIANAGGIDYNRNTTTVTGSLFLCGMGLHSISLFHPVITVYVRMY